MAMAISPVFFVKGSRTTIAPLIHTDSPSDSDKQFVDLLLKNEVLVINSEDRLFKNYIKGNLYKIAHNDIG